MHRTQSLYALAAAAALAAPSARAAEEFAPVKATETVTYPLPALPLPPAPQTTSGKWAETEDSPALRVSRAWVKLGEGAGVERSQATRNLFQSWKNEVGKSGASSRASQSAHATFLAAYKKDLESARAIYEGVLREVDALDGEGATGPSGADTAASSLARE